MKGTAIALLRGINVGRAKRVAMADLRTLVEGLGYCDVRTVLNSGNIVFTVPGTVRGKPAARIEEALRAQLGLSARVMGLTAAELANAVAANPLLEVADDHARLLVGVFAAAPEGARLAALAQDDWTPEVLAVGPRVAYLWCPAGILESPLLKAVNRALGDAVTMRNWATMLKLHALVQESA